MRVCFKDLEAILICCMACVPWWASWRRLLVIISYPARDWEPVDYLHDCQLVLIEIKGIVAGAGRRCRAEGNLERPRDPTAAIAHLQRLLCAHTQVSCLTLHPFIGLWLQGV